MALEGLDAADAHQPVALRIEVQRMVFAIGSRPGRIGPGDALRDQPTRASLSRGGDEVARSFVADAPIARERAGALCRILNRSEVRQLMHDDLWLCLEHRRRQRLCVEDVDHHRARAELTNELGIVRRARRPPDRMAVGQQKGREPPPNDAPCSRQKDPAHGARSVLCGEFRSAGIC